MNSLYIVLCISLTVYSCGLFESNGDIGVSDKVYVALQGADTVRVVNFETGTLESIAINYDIAGNEPHFIAIDEVNRYWFVTAFKSGWVARYNLDTNELIDKVLVGNRPALMVLNSEEKSGLILTDSLMDFSLKHPIVPDQYNKSLKNNLWTELSAAHYGFIIPNTSSYLVIGKSGGHNSGIGYKITQDNGRECGGPCSVKAGDSYNYFWFFSFVFFT